MTKTTSMKKFLGRALLALVALVVVTMAYGEVKVRWAKRQVEKLANEIAEGDLLADVESKAKARNLSFKITNDYGNNNGRAKAWEGFIMDRWLCGIEYKNGKVVSKYVGHVQ